MNNLGHLKDLDKRIRLNVGGMVFDTWVSTLERVPGTRLSQVARQQDSHESWDAEKQEYFFDRHPGAFMSIIHYYRTEELHTDHNICGNVIKGELEWWGLTELDIEPCCWGNYSKFKDHKETLTALDDTFSYDFDMDAFGEKPTAMQKFRRRMWSFLEEPSSSLGAKVYAFVSMFFVILSIGVFVLETHELFRDANPGVTLGNSSITATCSSSDCRCRYTAPVLTINNSEPKAYMAYLDYVCAAFFTFEYLMRIFFAPRKLTFLKQPLNIIDLLCLVPHFVIIIVQMIDPQNATSDYFKPILALRIIRVMRIFKLMKHYGAFKIFAYTIKVSTKELLLMVVFLFTGVLIFASVIYYVENDTFHSIPIGFWWALVTMTTVGYGDKVPKSEGGFIIGSMCVLCGVLTVAFTVPIVVNNFTLYYSHAQSRIKLPMAKRKELKKKLVMKNQKNALEYVKKLTLSAHEFSQLESIKSPRDDIQSINHSKVERNGDLNSEMNISMCDSIPERKTPTPGQNRVSPISNTSEEKISTISETMIEDIQITDPCAPLTPSVPLNRKHVKESQQLLRDLAESDEKIKDERKRQLGMLNKRREQRKERFGERTPRTPAPAGQHK